MTTTDSEPKAEVLQLPEGSVLVLRGVDLPQNVVDRLVEQLIEAVGHQRFVVLMLPAGADAEVWGAGDGLLGKVRLALQRPEYPPQPAPPPDRPPSTESSW